MNNILINNQINTKSYWGCLRGHEKELHFPFNQSQQTSFLSVSLAFKQ